MYNEKVMDHFRDPRNVGSMEEFNGFGEVGNPKCGDALRIYIKVEDGAIEDVKFKAFGCGSLIASSSMATQLIRGRTLKQAWEVTNEEIVELLGGLPPSKIHCSVIAEDTIHNAINDYRKSVGLEPWTEENYKDIK